VKQLQPNYDSGDHLHPNDAGYQAMAAAIAPTQFLGGSSPPFRPRVSAATAKNQEMDISWTATADGFILGETGTLTPPVDWQFSPLTPILSNGVFSVSVPVSSTSRFFRLITTP
jgi:hypothetical protein